MRKTGDMESSATERQNFRISCASETVFDHRKSQVRRNSSRWPSCCDASIFRVLRLRAHRERPSNVNTTTPPERIDATAGERHLAAFSVAALFAAALSVDALSHAARSIAPLFRTGLNLKNTVRFVESVRRLLPRAHQLPVRARRPVGSDAERNENKWFVEPRRRLVIGILDRNEDSSRPCEPISLVEQRCQRSRQATTHTASRTIVDTRCRRRLAQLPKELS